MSEQPLHVVLWGPLGRLAYDEPYPGAFKDLPGVDGSDPETVVELLSRLEWDS